MKITLVKKINMDGNPCQKCAEVIERLEKNDLMGRIDQIVIADERDPESKGIQLAQKYAVDKAPFFIVEKDGMAAEIYTIYFKFVNEVLNKAASEQETVKDILDAGHDLDFL